MLRWYAVTIPSVRLAQAAGVVSVLPSLTAASFMARWATASVNSASSCFTTLACSISALAVAAGTLDMLVFARLLMALGLPR
jgi:hypothetical protein